MTSLKNHTRQNRYARLLPVLLLTGIFTGGSAPALAQTPNCLEQARSSSEIDQCGGSLMRHLETRMESDYKRLHERFAGNEKMQERLKASRESWEIYRNNQCLMEASAASGQYVVKPLSLEANKIYFQCMLRTFGEMRTTLEKLHSSATESTQTAKPH
ncbi:MAG: DUF1311 domain-containing protein [Sterolibacterium sp.]|nr:DUF1311 domain-containing protein [Sterolibacterium sp.]